MKRPGQDDIPKQIRPEHARQPEFIREKLAEQIERIWEVCAPVIDAPPVVEPYAQGSWGPEAALQLPGPRGWRLPDGD